ncbi:MAG: hypothetical protein ACRC0X_04300 [Brevinema sp.]
MCFCICNKISKWIKRQREYNKLFWFIIFVSFYILAEGLFIKKFLDFSNSESSISIMDIGLFIFARLAYNTYRKQAEIADTNNLMTTWCEHNRIMESINDPSNKDMKSLKYFELLMFFERICGLYYTEWKNSERIKKEFYVLYDATIDANCRKHFEESLSFLYLNYGNFIYEYDLANAVRYLKKIDDPKDNDSLRRRRNIKHYLNASLFNIDYTLDILYKLYTDKPTGKFNENNFQEYKKK